MSSTVTGYLDETDSKSGTSKAGKPWTMYKGTVNGKWYSFGFTRPSVAKGEYVELTVELENDYEVVKSAKVVPAPTPAATKDATAPASSGGYQDRNSSIVYQSSRKDALALVDVLITQDALPVTATKTGAGKAKRFEEIMALVDKLTVQYYYDVITLRNLDRVVDAGASAPAPVGLPEDAQEEPAASVETDEKW
jgi:hypothetical protein